MSAENRAHHGRPAHARPSRRVRRRRLEAAVLALVVVAVVLIVVWPSGSPPVSKEGTGQTTGARSTSTSGTASASKKGTDAIPAVEAGVLPWTLGAALSREVVLPGPGNDVTVVGGLTASQSTTNQVFSLDTTSGAETALPALASGVHDAAGAFLRGRGYLFGGGSPNTVATVQQFPAPPPALPAPESAAARHQQASDHLAGSGGTSASANARRSDPSTTTTPTTQAPVSPSVLGQLPQPRSDDEAVTIGTTTYVVGGYDGTTGDPGVLATTDGSHFSVAAQLPLAVRYPAVAALGDAIYVFGGQAVGGPKNGQAVDTVQMVLPGQGTATIVGHMPSPLAGASAFVLGGHVYLAGGVAQTAGAQPGPALNSVWAYDPSTRKVMTAGTMPVATSYAGVAVLNGRAWVVGGENAGTAQTTVEMMTPNLGFGTAGAAGAGSPYFGGQLLVADRGNNRLLLLNTANQIVWSYPSAYAAPPPGGFYFPDDAFFTAHGTEIISNQEQNETIVVIGFPTGKLLWSYGHPRQSGTQPGYLNEPDDAYVLKNGQITVADAQNCRVLFINSNGSIASQIGSTGSCVHRPPNFLGSPNGDTPLADGNVLISEINGSWVSEYTPQGQLVWTVQLPIGYPSDPQQIGADLYLVSDYSHPGGFIEFTREGNVVYRYDPSSGLGEMNQPSLTEVLPSGVFMTNDDYRDRMVAIDPSTQALVWQYGVADQPGTAPGMLNTPDGFDVMMANGATPTHAASG